ncbi:MAG: hypothetical protein LBG59_06920 [Candidatus Peribacteria bacterium]|nr:hypothetical protein [Candidatus Peribacteria bacterium]
MKEIEDEFLVKYVVNTQVYHGYLHRDYGMYKQQKSRKRTRSNGSTVKEYFA